MTSRLNLRHRRYPSRLLPRLARSQLHGGNVTRINSHRSLGIRHNTGKLRRRPWETLTGAPVIYASLGTLVNGQSHVYGVSPGGRDTSGGSGGALGRSERRCRPAGYDPSNVIVVRSAPQIELPKRVTLITTHAASTRRSSRLRRACPWSRSRSGTTSRALLPGFAHHGVGEFVAVEDLDADRLCALIQRVLMIEVW